MIRLRPATRAEWRPFVATHHRHAPPPLQSVLAVAAEHEGRVVGVAVVEVPKARALMDGRTWEVSRLCLLPDAPHNAGSRLLGACWRAARAVGVERMISHTRADETGGVFVAAGWRAVADLEARAWDTGSKGARWLPGLFAPTSEVVPRVRWEIARSVDPAVDPDPQNDDGPRSGSP